MGPRAVPWGGLAGEWRLGPLALAGFLQATWKWMSESTQLCHIPSSEESGPHLGVCGLVASRLGETVLWWSVVGGEVRHGPLAYLVWKQKV